MSTSFPMPGPEKATDNCTTSLRSSGIFHLSPRRQRQSCRQVRSAMEGQIHIWIYFQRKSISRCSRWNYFLYLFLWIFQGFCKELYLSSPLRFGGVFCGYSLRSSGRSTPGRPAIHWEVFYNCHDAGEYCFVYSVSLLMTENIRCTSFALRTFIILITCLPSFSLRS